MLLSKLREAWICLKAGQVTLPYPFEPHDPPPGFRGKIEVDPDLCFGCGGCANVCPAGVIEIQDPVRLTRVLTFHWSRCTYCGRCEEVCPEHAITMSPLYETSTERGEDLVLRLEVFMGPCGRCGRCFPPPGPMERMMVTGFRDDAHGGRPEAWSPGPLGPAGRTRPGPAAHGVEASPGGPP
jgi:hydrogenase-4 component H